MTRDRPPSAWTPGHPGVDLGPGEPPWPPPSIGLPGLALFWVARAHLGIKRLAWYPSGAPRPLVGGAGADPLRRGRTPILEEIVVVGYLVTRLVRDGVADGDGDLAGQRACLRGSLPPLPGLGAFLGNAVMGVVFALFFLRTRRVLPLVAAHTVLDVVAFVGYALLAPHVSWWRRRPTSGKRRARRAEQ